MLIEDNQQMVSYIGEYLIKREYIVGSVNNFDRVSDDLASFKPNLILLDINLPKFDGFFFLKIIQKQFDIPVVIYQCSQ